MRNTMIFLSRMVLIGFICALFSLGYTTEVKAYSITVEIMPYGGNEYGTISPAEGNHEYEDGQEIDIIATPNPGFIFEKWDNNGGITANAYSASTKFTVTNDGRICASFLVAPTITFNANGGSCTTESARVGTNRKLASLPTATRDGYTCTGWYTDASGGDPVTTDTEFTSRTTIYAHWATTRTVTFSVVNGKWDDDSTANKTVPVANGGSLTLAQIPDVGNKPNGGYKVGSWSSPAPNTSTQITDNVTYTYTYAADTHEYPINWDQQGQGDIDVRVSNQTVYSARYNTSITLMAQPFPGWSFSGWESSDVEITNPTSTSSATFLMPQKAVMLTAVFTQNPVTNHTVTYHVVNGKWNDTNTSEDRTETVANGQHPADIPPVGSKPNAGYKAGNWNTNPSTATITTNRTFTYTYASDTPAPTVYNVTVTTDGHGEAYANKRSGVSGTNVKLREVPDDGYRFKQWEVISGGVVLDNYRDYTPSFTIGSADVVIKAHFEKKDEHTRENDYGPEESKSEAAWTPEKAAATIAAEKAAKQQAAGTQIVAVQTMLRTFATTKPGGPGEAPTVINLDMTKVDILDRGTVNLLVLNNKFEYNIKISVVGGLTTTVKIPANFNFRPFIKADGTMNIHEVLWSIVQKEATRKGSIYMIRRE